MALTKVSGGILDPGISVAGIVTATGFDGPFIGGSSKNIIAGIITATGLDVNGNGDISGLLTAGSANFTGNVSIGGTLTYEDVKNVDSVGIITARKNILVGGANEIVGTPYNYFYGRGSGASGVSVYAAEASLELVGSNAGSHVSSLLFRTAGNDGIGFNYNAGGNVLELKSFDATGNNFQIHASGSNVSNLKNILKAVSGGAVELYHNNTKRLETTSTGISVTNQVKIPDGGKYFLGSDDDMYLNHSGSHGAIHNATGNMYFSTAGSIFFSTQLNESAITANANGAVELYHDNVKKLETTNVGAKVTHSGAPTRIVIGSTDASGAWLVLDGDSNGDGAGSDYAYIEHNSSGHLNLINPVGSIALKGGGVNSVVCQEDAEVVLYHNGNRKFETTTTGTKVTGNLEVTDDIFLSDTNVAYFGTNNDMRIYHSGTHGYIKNTVNNLYFMTTNSKYGALMYANGAVELRFDDVKKFETTTLGAKISGNLELSSTYPSLTWTDTNHNSDFRITNDDGKLIVYDITRGAHVMDFLATGDVRIRNDKGLTFGEGNDLAIAHDGSLSRLSDTYGHLKIASNLIEITNQSLGENYIKCTNNAAVDLYYDNAVKLTTSTTGITVTGEVAATQDYPDFKPTLDFNFAATKKLDPRITYTRTGSASYYDEFGKVVLVGDNVPRFDHDPDTRESKGLLIEQSSTNEWRNSESLHNGTNGYTLPNGLTTPAGGSTAVKIQAGANYLWWSSGSGGFAVTSGDYWTMSWWAYSTIQSVDFGNSDYYYLSNTTISQDKTVPAGQWKRCFRTVQFNASGSPQIRFMPYGSTLYTDTNNEVFVWGFQFEKTKFPTSYIPTYGYATTRGNELCQITGEDFSDFYNQDEGTIVTEHSIIAGVSSGDNTYVYQVDDGNDLNVAFRLLDHNSAHGDALRAYGFLSNNWNSPLYGSQTSTPDHDSFLKVAVGIKKDDFGINFFGGTTYTDTSGDINVDMTQITLGNHRGGTAPLQGYLKRFIYYPQKLTTNQLKTITS